MGHIVGIDVGSSSVKAGLFSPDGRCAGLARRSYPTTQPAPQHHEQDPEVWWSATMDAIRELRARRSKEEVVAIGVAGHISSLTLVDRAGRPLRPALAFRDQRATAEVKEISSRFNRAELAGGLGIDLPPAPTWSLPRLLWFRRHEPHVLHRAHCLLQAKDFVNFRLTVAKASDASSSRSLVHAVDGSIPAEIFSDLGLPARLLPGIKPPEAIIGCLCGAAANAIGLRAGVPVVNGWNDLNASVLGCGAVHPGSAFNITGSSEHLGVVAAGLSSLPGRSAREHSAPGLVCAPFLPGLSLLYGATSCGGGSLDWYAQTIDQNIEDLIAAASQVPSGSEGLIFLPYLEGERSPIWDPSASGAFVGIRMRHQTGHLVRAILEGVAFSLLHITGCLSEQEGNLKTLAIGGGAARIPLWNQVKANVLGVPVAVSKITDTGSLGAAMLASAGAGFHSSVEDAARAMAAGSDLVRPSSESAEVYAALYRCYRDLYPALRRSFEQLRHIASNVEEVHV